MTPGPSALREAGSTSGTGTLTALYRHPVKSCRGLPVERARVERAGLDGDRRWMLAHPDGTMATARTLPRLVLAVPEPAPDGLAMTAPGMAPLSVAVPPPDAEPMAVRVHRWDTAGLRAGPAADAWFSELAGTDVALVHLDDPDRRRPDPAFSDAGDRVSYADGFPVLLAAEESLAQVNTWIGDGPRAHEGPVPMIRFRPNVVVSGFAPFAEDGWRRVRIGDALFRVPKGCARCVLTTVDPDTAEKGKEPLATLGRHRRFDKGVWFGVNLIPDDPGAEIRVGDPVEILDSADPSGGPPR
ncbi:MOSC N-terminal beta barrel domain-containing protein [Pseudonocardia sp. KRD291]|uniref:MOSC domain-containing protein n=1 Tax=Pseudonocardia sp. KRD291 TaxID=2792007 RepID=UPI0027E30B1A|nr:MOSC N-terminal beta barrel domain-containing protein [Pseudonocardia sp. KRD291]